MPKFEPECDDEAPEPWPLMFPRGPNDLNMVEVVENAAEYAASQDLFDDHKTLFVLLTAQVAERVEEMLHEEKFSRVRVQVMKTPVAEVDCLPGDPLSVEAASYNLPRIQVKKFRERDEEVVEVLAGSLRRLVRTCLSDDIEHFIFMPYLLLTMGAVHGVEVPCIPFLTRFGMFSLRRA